MNKDKVLWTQSANKNSSTVKNFMYFLYEFVGARLTIIAFLGLFNLATYSMKYFGHFLTISIAIFLYYIISDAFNVFWTGINLKYTITEKGINYHWGVWKNHALFISFKEISRISSTHKKKGKRSALIFENLLNYKNADFGFSNEIYFDHLSFENIEDMDKLINIIQDISNIQVEVLSDNKAIPWTEKIPESNLYFKFVQLLGFVFLFLATNIGLKLIDNNLLESAYVEDTVISQHIISEEIRYRYNRLETQEGYQIELRSFSKYKGKKVAFYASPLFRHVTKFESFNDPNLEINTNGFIGYNRFFKFVALFMTLFSGSFIFYKRANIPIEDLGIFLILPTLVLIVAFYLY